MSSKQTTMAERLARIETLLDEKVVPMVESINQKVDADVADLAKLKNRGAGILVGVSVVFTTLGTLFHKQIMAIVALFR